MRSSVLSRITTQVAFKNSQKAVYRYANNRAYNQQVGQQIEKIRVLHPEFPMPKEGVFSYFPQAPGDEMDVNWSLQHLSIAPLHYAYKNAATRTLFTYSYGRIDENKALCVESATAEPVDNFVTNKTLSGWVAQDFSPKSYRRSLREVTYHISHSPCIFMNDADGGAYRDSKVKVRVATDNAVAALYLKNLSLPVTAMLATKFKPEAIVIHAAAFQFMPSRIVEEFGGPTVNDLGLSSNQFMLTNENTNTIAIAGVQKFPLIKEAIAFLSSKIAFGQGNVLLPADSLVTRNGDRVVLVFNNSEQDLTGTLLSEGNDVFALYGAHHNMLAKEGLSRFWGGLSVEARGVKTQQGDLIEQLEGGSVRVTRLQKGNIPNLIKAPETLVFLVNDPNFLVPSFAKVNSLDDALQLAITGFKGIEKELPVFKPTFASSSFPSVAFAQQMEERLRSLLPANTQAYVINSASENNVKAALKLIASGEAAKLQALPSKGLWSVVKHASIQEQPWKDQNSYTQRLEQLVTAVQQQFASLPKPPAASTPEKKQ